MSKIFVWHDTLTFIEFITFKQAIHRPKPPTHRCDCKLSHSTTKIKIFQRETFTTSIDRFGSNSIVLQLSYIKKSFATSNALKLENLLSFIYEFNRSKLYKKSHSIFFPFSCYFFVCIDIECENSTRFIRSFDSIRLDTQLNSQLKEAKRKHQHTNGIGEQLCVYYVCFAMECEHWTAIVFIHIVLKL